MSKRALIFDLDGVIVDTAKYHYIAWKELAEELYIPFTEKDNERLKGVSRMASFEILLGLGNLTMSEEEKQFYCNKKNERYVSYIQQMTEDEVLPGVCSFLEAAKRAGYGIALGSASKNARMILENLKLTQYFDAIVDGNKVSKAKPDPEVFTLGAQLLFIPYEDCIVFEDSIAGIEAAHAVGMSAVGIGDSAQLGSADLVIPGFSDIDMKEIEVRLSQLA